MSTPKTSEKSVYLDREEHFHRGEVGGKVVVPYYYDATTDTLSPASNTVQDRALTTRINEASATVTYIGSAEPGTATSAASWQIKKIDSTSGTSITYADGNANYDNVWDNHTSLSYS